MWFTEKVILYLLILVYPCGYIGREQTTNTNKKVKTMFNIQFKTTKQIVWTGTWDQYLIDFQGGLDKDNLETFEIVPAK